MVRPMSCALNSFNSQNRENDQFHSVIRGKNCEHKNMHTGGGHVPPPGPIKTSHKKDGHLIRLHRFHVSRPPPPPGCWIRYCETFKKRRLVYRLVFRDVVLMPACRFLVWKLELEKFNNLSRLIVISGVHVPMQLLVDAVVQL